jgi:hypothetical protein
LNGSTEFILSQPSLDFAGNDSYIQQNREEGRGAPMIYFFVRRALLVFRKTLRHFE